MHSLSAMIRTTTNVRDITVNVTQNLSNDWTDGWTFMQDEMERELNCWTGA